jgi:ATP-binding protein involved in chromosome partitioning
MAKKISPESILRALGTVQEPELHRDLVSLNMIRDLEVASDRISFTIMLTTPACPLKGSIENSARQAVMAVSPATGACAA